MSRTIKLDFGSSIIVSIENALKLVALRAENVSIKSKTVRSSPTRAISQPSSETVNWIHLVGVIILQNIHNGGDGLRVIIYASMIQIMKRIRIINMTVRKREIDSNVEANLATTEDVVQK